MYYSCIPNENSLAMNNTWLVDAENEESKERERASSDTLKGTGQLHPHSNPEEQMRKKSLFSSNRDPGDTSESIHAREELYASNKLQSITDRADSEESPRSRFQTMSEGFFEPNSFMEEEPGFIKQKISVAHRFSFGTIGTAPTSADSEVDQREEDRKKCIKSIQETFGFLDFVFGQSLDGYQKIYENTENKLDVKMKTVKTNKGIQVICVHAEWFVKGNADALVRYINSARGMNDMLQHIGSVEEYENFNDDKGQKYTVYGMSYEAGLNTQVKGPAFVRSYKAIGDTKWRDAFRVVDAPSLTGQIGELGTRISVGGHVIFKVPGEEGKYKIKLYFETVLPGDGSELISENLLAEKVQVYVSGFNDAVN